MIYQLSALWLLLTAAAAAELYDELPEGDEIPFQEENDIDTGPLKAKVEESAESRLRDLLLFKLIRAQLRGELQDTNRRSHKDQEMELVDAAKSLVKRVAPDRGARSQRWWKTKKGRGTQMCYFKLCAFRYPA